ncbi:LOW QUALITY PROTEIN: uncharacterized protein ACR2FA_002183 [Aphomia sociella]
MMLTIHGLPVAAKFQEIRAIIKGETNLNDFILDNLVKDIDGLKKIRIGVADESEGAHLIKCLNGFRMSGQILRVVPVGKTPMNTVTQPPFDQRGNYPPRNEYPNQVTNFNRQEPGSSTQPGWAGNQWSHNPQQMPNNFNYQQPTPNLSYLQQQQTQSQGMVQREQFPNRMATQEPMYRLGVRPTATKALMPDPKQPRRPHVLRNVEIVDRIPSRPVVAARYPGGQGYEQQKSITIMKDNFQGPNQYPDSHQNTPRGHPVHGQEPVWQHQGLLQKPTPFSKDNLPYKSQYEDERKYPDRHPSGMKNPEHHVRGYEKPRGFSPQRRSPMSRGISPGRKMSPGRPIPRGILDGRPHGVSDDRPRGGPDGRPQSGPDGRPHRGPDNIPHRGPDGRPHIRSDGRPHGGPDTRAHMGPDGRPHGGPDTRPHMGPDGRSHGGPDTRAHMGPDGRPHGGPDGRHGPQGRPHGGQDTRSHGGPDGRPYSRPEGRFHGGPDERPNIETDGRPHSGPSGRTHIGPDSRLHGGPDDRRISPGRRVLIPVRRPSPSERRISPSERRFSPSGRRMSPSGRRMSPGDRRMGDRQSPIRRLESPERPSRRQSDARHAMRYSPSRRHMDKSEGSLPKQVRPAYEPEVQAQNEAMYSGGYRPNLRENVQYPIPGTRQAEHHHSPWQDRENPASAKKMEEDRRDRPPMSRGTDRLSEHGIELKRQPSPRKSRSPVRRERSPIRDRYRRHSPSPRSPRRSWALEKRRSPIEAPPPPVWPGQNVREEDQYSRPGRSGFHDKNELSKPSLWERPSFHQKNEEHPRDRRPDAFSESSRHRDMEPREPIHRLSSPVLSYKPEDERFLRREQPKFKPLEDFHRQEMPERKHHTERDDHREIPQRSEHEVHHGEIKRQVLHRRPKERIEDYRKRQETFDKELDDVYKRAVEFAKKTDEMRRQDRRREVSDERRRDDDCRDERQFRRDDEPRRISHESPHDFRQEDRTSKHEERPKSRHSSEYQRVSREKEWKTGSKNWTILDREVKAKREKASEEISKSIIEKHRNLISSEEMGNYILEEMKNEVLNLIQDLFGDNDVSFIEMVVKCNSKFEGKDGDRIFKGLMSRLPAQYRNLKRSAAELPENSAKNFKRSPQSNLNVPDWNLNTGVTNLAVNMQYYQPQPVPPVDDMNSLMHSRFMSTFDSIPRENIYLNQLAIDKMNDDMKSDENDEDGFHLYLCTEDFQPLSSHETEELKQFLVSEMFKVTESSGGWAPNFIFKGLQSHHRYELVTNDPMSKDWLVNLDFSEFQFFKVLVYTKEELWYERAAIWLPGHSKYRYKEPFVKLQLQNQKLQELNIGKWKLVKKIVNPKGTRLYVDMPPSSARVLEKNKLLLSYELQKVNVFLRAVAVDKSVFDAGLNEESTLVKGSVRSAISNSPMPSLNQNDPNIIKIELKGSKTLTLQQARQIKELVIQDMFKYLEGGGTSKTDFEKYGFCSPNYFGLLPANIESKRWLLGRNIGKLNRQQVIIVGGDDMNIRYFTMFVVVPYLSTKSVPLVCERLKQSNQGVKGLNFSLWKPKRVETHPTLRNKSELEVEVDMESVESIIKMNFTLDYIDDRYTHTAHFKPKDTKEKLLQTIEKYKSEQLDSYDVANMEIESLSGDGDDDDDIVCLGEVDA